MSRDAQPFSIEFVGESDDPECVGSLIGEIRAVTLLESFLSPTDIWDADAYVAQWTTALSALVTGHEDNALLVSTMDGNGKAWFVQAYTLHRVGGTDVALRERLWLPEWLPPGFGPDRLDMITGPRDGLEPGERPPSEWVFALDDIRQFLAGLVS